ncbi:glycoside hydrolase, partial [Pseudoflavonifractor phocaeensis]|nr:glycoside hydrolase [Pseudoflavonifractor phocaeensis]
KGGTGSGDVYLKDGANINVRQGFEDYGYTIVNADFLDEQEALYEENGTGGGGMWGSAVYKEPAYDAEKVNAIEGTDTAIYVLARNSGEGSDRKLEGGDYYLTDEEAYNLTLLG